MVRESLKNGITAVVALALVGSAVTAGATLASQHQTDQPNETSYLRVAHMSPDTDAVNVTVGNETVTAEASFGNVTEYVSFSAGTYNVTISDAEDQTDVLFEGNLTLDPTSATTVVATGETSSAAQTAFEPVVTSDDATEPDSGTAALRVFHASPDVGAVNVVATGWDNDTTAPVDEANDSAMTPGDGEIVLADNVTFRNDSGYVYVPVGEYSVEVREARDDGDGTLIAEFNATVQSGAAYTVLAAGYLNPTGIRGGESFEVVTVRDATTVITLPGTTDDEGTTQTPGEETPTETPTATPVEETPTETPEVTPTPGDRTPTDTPEATPTPTTPTPTPEGTPTSGIETPTATSE